MLFTFACEAAGASGARLSLRPLFSEGQSSCITSGDHAAGSKAHAWSYLSGDADSQRLMDVTASPIYPTTRTSQIARDEFNHRLLATNNMKASTNMKKPVKKPTTPKSESPSRLIDARIRELNDWRGEMLARVRALIKQADPDVIEEWKWRGVPVWSHDGIICTGETYRDVVKLTFAKGASLKDPSRLFNSSLEGNVRRAIDLHEGDKLDADAFKMLIRGAIALNRSKAR
jgi:hypothetical protein